jgi:hypothetical protein
MPDAEGFDAPETTDGLASLAMEEGSARYAISFCGVGVGERAWRGRGWLGWACVCLGAGGRVGE